MINLDQVKITPREQQVLNLLVQGCSNKAVSYTHLDVYKRQTLKSQRNLTR